MSSTALLGFEPVGDPRVEAIARAAREPMEKRYVWRKGPFVACPAGPRHKTDAYLANLCAGDLDRKVRFFDGSERPLADVLVILIVHTASHAGEIAALKGVQGVQGLPC